MRIYKAMIIGFMMISWISCSDDVSSTEVENEVYNLKGIAATGYALVNKEVDVYNQDGQHLINSSTDEHGKFSTDLQGEGVEKGDFLIF